MIKMYHGSYSVAMYQLIADVYNKALDWKHVMMISDQVVLQFNTEHTCMMRQSCS